VTGRSYLSIGDVLTLLREEFPDVTISKIRFLESQGLVNPERSPSGYRKFFEADVERLRWVLRQQREHFLPLKVIRDRLAGGDVSESETGSHDAAGNGRVGEPVRAAAGAAAKGRARTVGAGSTATVAPLAQVSEEDSSHADDEAMARILADASRRAARPPGGVGEHITLERAIPDPGAPVAASAPAAPESGIDTSVPTAGSAPTGTVTAEPPSRSAPAAVPAPSIAPTQATPSSRERHVNAPDVGVAAASSAAAVPRSSPALRGAAQGGRGPEGRDHTELHGDGHGVRAGANGEPARPSAMGRQSATGGQGAVPPEKRTSPAVRKPPAASSEPGAATSEAQTPATVSMVTGASMTTEELCAASGLSGSELAGLQGFGLIEPVLVAGIPTFDEDALTVANLAADFRKFGIEARHLRPYRNAVDREMGLIEQVIIPLLRQRNPESRQRAAAAADELGALGQTMRATLMRSALRRHVGG
jgi:DNA-binding transcriptional MerR regulator